jgi:hypothetical protein
MPRIGKKSGRNPSEFFNNALYADMQRNHLPLDRTCTTPV